MGQQRAVPQAPSCRASGPRRSRGGDQRQGPELATSFRSHVSRRRRLKMTLASWHRGESWNPGRRRSRAEPGIPFGTKSPPDAHRSESQLPSRLNLTRSSLQSNRPTACATHSSPCLGTPPRWPQGLPPEARPDQLELQGQHEGHGDGEEPSVPGTLPVTLLASDQSPDWGTPRPRESWLRNRLAKPVGLGWRPGGAERAGRARGAGGAGGTHAGPHVPPRGRQQLQGRAGAGEPLGARQAAQHRLGVRQAPDHEAEARTRLRGASGS